VCTENLIRMACWFTAATAVCLSELARDPFRCRILCHVNPDQLSPIQPDYGAMRRIRAMGMRDKPIAPASPWQNGFAERLIGSIRRECLDHLVVLSEVHLRRMLQAYAGYCNKIRTHRSLDKDAPAFRPVQRIGAITSHPILGGLHHHYVRVEVFGTHKGCPLWVTSRAQKRAHCLFDHFV
jgi:Integrase core domain